MMGNRGPDLGSRSVIRCDFWHGCATVCRALIRRYGPPGCADPSLGLRLLRTESSFLLIPFYSLQSGERESEKPYRGAN